MFRTLAPTLAASLLLATACATEAGEAAVEVRTGPAASTIRAVPEVTADAGTAAFEVVLSISSGGRSMELVGSGAYDSDAQRMAMETDVGAMFDELAAGAGESIPPGLDEPMRVVVDGDTMYVQPPAFGLLGAGASWVSVGLGDAGLSGGVGLAIGAYDPTQLLEGLGGVTGEPELVGPEEVRGVSTTRYAATMDLGASPADEPAGSGDRVEEPLGVVGEAEVAVDVWIDDGLLRRMRMDLATVYASMGADADEAIMTIELFDYGQPVAIELPEPDDVTPLGELTVGAFGSGS